MMDFAKLIKQERTKLKLNRKQFARKIGATRGSIVDWEERGKIPTKRSLVKLAKLLGWDDEETLTIFYQLENITEVTPGVALANQAIIKGHKLGMTVEEVASEVGVGQTSFINWSKGKANPTKTSRDLMTYFLKREVIFVPQPIEEYVPSKERIVIDYKLLHKLEDKYESRGGLRAAPSHDPLLRELQNKMNGRAVEV